MKKTIIIASSILLVILLVIFLLSKIKKPEVNNQKLPSITPTTVPLSDYNLTESDKNVFNTALMLTPYEDEDFAFDYIPDTNQLIVKEKTQRGRDKFNEWTTLNGLPELANNNQIVVFEGVNGRINAQKSINEPILNLINIFYSLGRGSDQSDSTNQEIINQNPPNQFQNQGIVNNSSNFKYFAQCDSEYADLPLPSGCNLCQAGCGPSTVAMITSSYLGQNYNPQIIIGKYQTLGYELSCAGSSYADAKSLLESLGLKTTDYLVFNYEPADTITADLKKFIDAGWTFFTLANFTDSGGGHYFWLTDIDSQGNFWAYDPFYGRFQAPPYNENDRYPFPKYRLAFGVKR